MNMKGTDIFRFVCITLLWVFLCYLMIASQPFTPWLAFVLLASAIVVFVPLYKKYVRSKK
ncbi:MAG: hypothetical protein HDS57_04770 [Barnesiella sp.]|nr:hypothetical protein [Barnesiella sp.]MBD5374660.1 hypothetical protein [Bacteroides sp.]